MADISKCGNESCPLKEKCYRYTAPIGFWQGWMDYIYDDGCDDYWDNKEYEKEK